MVWPAIRRPNTAWWASCAITHRALAEKNIRVNTVHPTGVATPMLMNDYVEQFFGEHPEALPALQNLLPVR